MKGKFITFEGVDGAGKSTQIKLIADRLTAEGKAVVLTREPGGTGIAERVRNIVLDVGLQLSVRTEALLFMAARSEHIEQIIKPALMAGKVVLCDRFCDSTFVYQGLTQGKTVTELDSLRNLNLQATDGIMPDLTVVLDADPKELLLRRDARGVTDRFENKGLDFQENLRAGFLALAQAEPQRIKVVNALDSVEAVNEQIFTLVKNLLG
ncbi:MAG: dTMP kinase [Phascolarctobacterium sp.]|nr:dTMP kinase [Candidatus Phascolarctobacterium caballi]